MSSSRLNQSIIALKAIITATSENNSPQYLGVADWRQQSYGIQYIH